MFISVVATATLVTTTGCVIGEPDFREPVPTRPELRAVDPLTTQIVPQAKVESDTFAPLQFNYTVLSEDADRPPFEIVLLNYGHPDPRNPLTPYERRDQINKIDPGTLEDGPRNRSFKFSPTLVNSDHECVQITLLVTRDLYGLTPFENCPADPAMADTLTWFVPLCDTLANCDAQDCVNEPEGGYRYCPDDPAAAATGSTP